jgi:hypothetical protein
MGCEGKLRIKPLFINGNVMRSNTDCGRISAARIFRAD